MTSPVQEELYAALEKEPLFRKGHRRLSMEAARELNHKRWARLLEMDIITDVRALLTEEMLAARISDSMRKCCSRTRTWSAAWRSRS